uniref:Uncharacterized protein n=1 Tax=Ditylenchus dipsaci TaxID=166011 RepID=A0A915EHR0_9BILA
MISLSPFSVFKLSRPTTPRQCREKTPRHFRSSLISKLAMSSDASTCYRQIMEEDLEKQKRMSSLIQIMDMFTAPTEDQSLLSQEQPQQQQKKSSLNLCDYVVTPNRPNKRKADKKTGKSKTIPNGTNSVSPASSTPQTDSPAKPFQFPSRRECAERIFGPVLTTEDMQIAVHYFLALLDAVPKYMEQNKDLKEWRSKTDLNVLQILIQSFLSWLPYKNQQHRILLKQAKEAAKLEQEKMEKEKQEELQKLGVTTNVTEAKLMDSTSELKLDKAETQQDNNQKYNYPKKDDTHILSLDLRQKLLKQLISIDFPWHDDKMAILADLVVQAVEQGQASYCLLHYCIARHNAAILFTDPSLILVTLLLGQLQVFLPNIFKSLKFFTANMVEIFANNRDDDFRAKVRSMLLEAESLTKNEQAYMEAVNKYTHRKAEEVPSFDQFGQNVTTLMAALRNEQADDNLIAQSWAFRSLTTGAYNCYIKKSCLPEQLDDLIAPLFTRGPTSTAASRWNSFKFDGRYTTHFDEVSFFSNEDFLSLPEGVEVFFIDTAFKMLIVENCLKECLKSDFPVVGLDSEWTAYAAKSRASILQIAFEKCVCILDLDQLHAEPKLLAFFDQLFFNKDVLK